MLGPFEAWHGGVPVDLGERQQRFALVVLLLNVNKPVPTERLIDIIWGANPPKSNLVIGYLTRLRKAFREAGATDVAIEKTPTGYLLRIDEQKLDTVRFADLCDRAAKAKRNGDPATAAVLWHEAIDLWRGRFLEDLDIDRVGGTEVITPDEAWIEALGELSELEMAAGNHQWVRDRLRPVVRAHPDRQRHAILLIRALLAGDDRVGALRVYHQTRDILDEYGVATSADLRSLAWLAQYGNPRITLPPRPARFTGRSAELAAIESAIRPDEPTVVWLCGAPGVGKSALAVEAAHALRQRFPDGQLFVELNGFTPNLEPTPPGEALTRLLGDLGLPAEQVPPEFRKRVALYRDKLAGTRTLIVLDNARSEEQVRHLIPEEPGCLAMVTSRKVGDLDAGTILRIDALPAPDAAALFGDLVGAQRVHGKAAEVSRVVARCGRLPMQIRIVASQLRRHDRWPLDELLRLLDEAGPSTPNGEFDQAGVVACLVSYRQLSEEQQRLFRLFGGLPGQDLGVPAAAALLGCQPNWARALLDDLHAVSLLEEVAPRRYSMLDPLREFAASMAQPSTLPHDLARSPKPIAVPAQPPKAVERLLDFYLVTTAAAIAAAFPFDRAQQPTVDRESLAALDFPDQPAAFEWLAAERANLVGAIRYAAAHGYSEHAWRLAVLLWRWYSTVGDAADWIETLELAKNTVLATETNRYGQAHVLLRLSAAHRLSGRLAHALELAASALPRWVTLGDVRGEANTLCAIATPTMELGNHDLAIAHYEAALEKYREISDRRGEAYTLSQLGYLNELHGLFEVAQEQQLLASKHFRALGHAHGLAHALDNLGSIRQRLGRFDEALANHEEAHTIAVDIGNRGMAAYALNNIGNVHRSRGRLDDAIRYQERARTVSDGVTDPYLRIMLDLDRGKTRSALGDHRGALRVYRAALETATRTGDRNQLAHANHAVAQALHAIGEHRRAAFHWQSAEAGFDELRQPEAAEIRREREPFDCACGYPTA
jgi:DNA-binding SARP family transcriptional activator/tetratricopeptide (TPR) repeat protein